MKGLVALVLSVGVVDSLNPSTVGPAVYLATRKHAVRSLLGFTLGVLAVNVAAGVLLTLGPGQAILAAVPDVGEHTKHLVEVCLGLAVLALACLLWPIRHRIAHQVIPKKTLGHGSSLALGAGIALANLPTAFPYFAVIAVIIGSDSDLVTQATLIVLFNLVVIIPLLAILAISIHPGEHGDNILGYLRIKLDQWSPTLIPLVVLIFAAALLLLGGIGLVTD
jgi:cytochrome c biogenesis protein CcdA